MSNLITKLVPLFVFFTLLFLFFRFAPSFSITTTTNQKSELFTVSAEGKVTVVPDIASLSLGVSNTSPTVKAAQNSTNQTINAIADALKKLGLDSKDIKTSNYSIYPQYDYTSGRSKVIGYQVSANLAVTIRDLDKLNTVIDTAASLGATNVGGIQLTVDESRLEKLRDEARIAAISSAKSKAEKLSSASGLQLDRLVNVSESSPNLPAPYYARSAAVSLDSLSEKTSIEPGSADVTTTVTLSYTTR